MTNLPTKYKDCRLNDRLVIDLKPFGLLTDMCKAIYYDFFQKVFVVISSITVLNNLDLRATDLKRNRGHLLTMTNLPTKYKDCRLNNR